MKRKAAVIGAGLVLLALGSLTASFVATGAPLTPPPPTVGSLV